MHSHLIYFSIGMENDPKKSSAKNCYSKNVTKILMEWLKKHLDYPYPTEEERIDLCEETGLTRKQLRIWLINTRKVKTFFHKFSSLLITNISLPMVLSKLFF